MFSGIWNPITTTITSLRTQFGISNNEKASVAIYSRGHALAAWNAAAGKTRMLAIVAHLSWFLGSNMLSSDE
jgi:hypothetical protein